MEDVIDVEIDYAARRGLPGFLSESFSGEGSCTPARSASPRSPFHRSPGSRTRHRSTPWVRPTLSPPEKVERFLAANWSVVSKLLTDHGPWEGLNTTRQEVIRFQTSAHTFSLILGPAWNGVGPHEAVSGSKGLVEKLEDVFRPGEGVELFPGDTQIFAWDDKGIPIQSTREAGAFHVRSDREEQCRDRGGLVPL